MNCIHCDLPVSAKGMCRKHYLRDYDAKNKERLRASAKARVAANPEARRATQLRYAEKHKEKIVARNAEKYQANREKKIIAAAQWRKENPQAARINGAAQRARRRAAEKRATPVWASMDLIKQIYEQAALISRQTGIPHEVDHVVPLVGKRVCGLHVHWNLEIVPASVNRSKGNKFELDVAA
jgi:hypothetical protein